MFAVQDYVVDDKDKCGLEVDVFDVQDSVVDDQDKCGLEADPGNCTQNISR